MKRILTLVIALLVGVHSLPAQNAAMEKRLTRALKLFPDADADKDGVLSMEEALKYVESHPELKEQLAAMKGGKGASAPAAPTTPAVASDLPPGPRLFVCAHSFMIFTSALLPPMAEAAGIGYQAAGKQMIGGSRVIQHWNLPDEKNQAKAALSDGKVDVLTLSPHMLLPDEGIDNFVKLGLEKNSKLRVLVQASWPARDGSPDTKFQNEKRNEATTESLHQMHDQFHSTWLKSLEVQVGALNTAAGHEAVCIVPVCDAVIALRERLAAGTAPGLTQHTDLFRDNLGHPLPPLATLVSYCHFACIYQRSPVGLPVPAGLKENPKAEELNTLLQQLAWTAVTQYPLSGVKVETAKQAD